MCFTALERHLYEPVRVVRVRELDGANQRGKDWKTVEREQTWIWVVAGERTPVMGRRFET